MSTHRPLTPSLLLVALLWASPSALAAPPEPPGEDPGRRLHALLAAADEEDLELDPQAALVRGDLRRAREFGDYLSDAYLARSEALLRERLRRIDRLGRERLGPEDRIAFDAFRQQTASALKAYASGVARIAQRMPIDHLSGQHVTFPQLSSGEGAAPFRTETDYQSGLARIDGFVVYLDRAVEKMRLGIRSGHVHHRVVAERVIGQLDQALEAGVEGSPLAGPIRRFPEGWDEATRSRLARLYRAAIGERVLPALRRLRSFLATDYLPACRTGAPGLSSLPDGAAVYAQALEQHTTTTLGAEEIFRLGLAEVARIRAEMERVRDRVGFQGPLERFFANVGADPRFQAKTGAELLERYRAVGERVAALLPRLFAELPRGRLEIRPVPAERESSASGAYYEIGTPDGSRPGAFFVNTSALPTRATHRITALYLHEALPGHHLQGSLAQEDTALCPTLRFGWNAGYGEGWALYAESLGDEMGLYDDPFQQLGRLDLEAIRAVRMVVDTGLHARGWSREAAIQYMVAHTTLDRKAVEQEVDRYVVWPGQATAYKVGELTIRALRKKAERAFGERFDVRAFHRQVLGTGAIPLSVLEAKIDRWIAGGAG